MAICKKFGYPDLFITITCNVNWSEIKEFVLAKGLSASDRPDIVCRVFKMKLDEMMTDFKKKDFFGKSTAGMLYMKLYTLYNFLLNLILTTIFTFYLYMQECTQ